MEKRTNFFGYNGWIFWAGIACLISLGFPNVPGSTSLRGGAGIFFIIGFLVLYSIDKKEAEQEKASQTVSQPSAPLNPTPQAQTAPAEVKSESENKIRCRFCGKLYSSEYNGCPHCKKK